MVIGKHELGIRKMREDKAAEMSKRPRNKEDSLADWARIIAKAPSAKKPKRKRKARR
jgi:hypothetical protein